MLANLECAFEHIPDLREVVVVQRMVRTGREPENAGIWLGRPLWPRVEHHLAGLPRPTNGFPFELVAMANFHWLVHDCLRTG